MGEKINCQNCSEIISINALNCEFCDHETRTSIIYKSENRIKKGLYELSNESLFDRMTVFKELSAFIRILTYYSESKRVKISFSNYEYLELKWNKVNNVLNAKLFTETVAYDKAEEMFRLITDMLQDFELKHDIMSSLNDVDNGQVYYCNNSKKYTKNASYLLTLYKDMIITELFMY